MSPPTSAEEETNVRVAARVRPLLPREKASGSCSCVAVHRASRQLVVGTRRTFAFDVVFDESARQTEVYEECVAPLLAGCLQGYNATILAYGQTGSGKTHTMGTGQASSDCSSEEEGITPRLIRKSFEQLTEQSAEVSFKATCCYMEIHNEEIRDLLQPNAPKHLIQVRENADGLIQVAGIHSEPCSSVGEMMRCLNEGSVQRTTGATLMNEQSSRSHSIFSIVLEQRRRSKRSSAAPDGGDASVTVSQVEDEAATRPMYRTAKFHLVDLAGSERAKRTGAVGSRFKESVSINSGLLALGNVISALGDPAKRGSHVPYRESKLTRLLQDGLGGNSRTLMIACASCADGDFEETLNTLKYANRARNIKNRPVVNRDPEVAQLAAMRGEIEELRNQLLQREAPQLLPLAAFSGEADGVGAAALAEMSEKADRADRQSQELAAQLVGAEAERETFRGALVDVYKTLCQHVPPLQQNTASAAMGDAAPQQCKQAVAAVSASLHAVWRVLSSAGGAGQAQAEWVRQLPNPPVPSGAIGDEGQSGFDLLGSAQLSADLADYSVGSDGLPAPAAELTGFRTLSEVRRDSTVLIRKYLDEIKRLETELTLYRRKTQQLQQELREAKEDLAKDEEIFEEKVQELRVVSEQNAELRDALASGSPGRPVTPLGKEVAPSSEERCDEVVRMELEESREAQQRLERELQVLAQSMSSREEKLAELSRSEREWGTTKQQYQRRLEQLQGELGDMHRQLASLQRQLRESASLKEQTRQMEEEKRRLEQLICEQEDCIRKKKQEFGRLRDLRQQDSRRIRELEAEVAHLAGSQREKEARLQQEHRREAQQIGELQRRLAREGQRVRELEKENLRHRENLKSSSGSTGPQRQRSAAPLCRRAQAGGTTPTGQQAARSASMDAAVRGAGGSSSSTSTPTARVLQLEQRLDEYVRRQEAAQGLEEDQKKRDALLRKQQQYSTYRRKIATKDALEQQEAQEHQERLETQLALLDRQLAEEGGNSEAVPRELRTRKEALGEELQELQRGAQAKRVEGLGILRDIDERLEVLQDEIDFREARVAKASQLSRPGASLDSELQALQAEDAKDLLGRFCEKVVRLRQRERQNLRRLASSEAQLQELNRNISDLQQVLRSQNATASRQAATLTKDFEAQIQQLQQQLSTPSQSAPEASRPGTAGSAGAGGGGPVEELAAQVALLKREKEALADENRRVLAQVQGLKQYNTRYYNVSLGEGVTQNSAKDQTPGRLSRSEACS